MLDFIAKLLGYIMDWIYIGLNHYGIANVGLTIVLFSLVMRLLLFPFTYIQQKKNKITQYIQPELNKIAKKYRGKKDQDSMMKQQQEQQAVYKKYGTSPTQGCLPMIIQFVILFAIIRIVYNIPYYISSINEVYMQVAEPMVKAIKDMGTDSSTVTKLNDLAQEMRASYFKDPTQVKDVISLLGRFKEDTWATVSKMFSAYPDVVNSIKENKEAIRELNDFAKGINITDYPKDNFKSPIILIPILAALFQWLQTKTIRQPEMTDDMAGMNTYMKVMMNTMPLMSLFFYSILPCGIGLYWAATAFFTMIQQVALNFYFDHKDIEKMIEKQVSKANASNKKSFYDKMMEASMNAAGEAGTTPNVPNGSFKNSNLTVASVAKMSTKKIESPNVESVVESKESSNEGIQAGNSTGNSIAAIANMLKDK